MDWGGGLFQEVLQMLPMFSSGRHLHLDVAKRAGGGQHQLTALHHPHCCDATSSPPLPRGGRLPADRCAEATALMNISQVWLQPRLNQMFLHTAGGQWAESAERQRAGEHQVASN